MQNIQQLIKLTEDNLEELKRLDYSGMSHPPSIFFEVRSNFEALSPDSGIILPVVVCIT